MKKIFDKRRVCIIITVAAIAVLLVCELYGIERFFEEGIDPFIPKSVEATVTRGVGSVVFLTILSYLGYKVLNPVKKPFWRSVLFCIPAICVVVNNLPIFTLLTGQAQVTAPHVNVALLAAECFAVGLFEETCFRGVVFLGFLKNRRRTTLQRFLALIFSSAVFGAVHLVNIFFGADPGAVIMQIGYSFLIGAMCSVVLMKTANMWICVLLHAVYNFCGALVPRCGSGTVWEPVTVTVTVIIALAATAYMTFAFFKTKEHEVDRLYN